MWDSYPTRLLRHPLVLAACLALAAAVPARAQQATSDVSVWYWVSSTHFNTYEAHLLIRNHTAEPLRGWTLRFRMPSPIRTLSNAHWSANGDVYTVRGVAWTSTIYPGDAVWVDFKGTFDRSVGAPSDCRFNDLPCAIRVDFGDDNAGSNGGDDGGGNDDGGNDGDDDDDDDDDGDDDGGTLPAKVEAAFTFTSIWENNYVAKVTLRNTGDTPVDGWRIRFPLDATISFIWNAKATRQDGWFEVRDEGWNRVIAPGAERSFGFQGVYQGRLDPPGDCSFNGTDCVFKRAASTAAEPAGDGLPERLAVTALYPNPFRTDATLHVAAGRSQRVVVELLDVLGRRVDLLYDGFVAAGAPLPVRVDGARLPAGLYLVRVRGEEGRVVQRTLSRL